MSGRPDSLYSIPEFHGGDDNIIVPVQEVQLNYAYSHLVEVCTDDEQKEYSEYFQYVIGVLRLEKPTDRNEATQLYEKLTEVGANGSN